MINIADALGKMKILVLSSKDDEFHDHFCMVDISMSAEESGRLVKETITKLFAEHRNEWNFNDMSVKLREVGIFPVDPMYCPQVWDADILATDDPPAGSQPLTREEAIDELQAAFREELRTCDDIRLREEHLDRLGDVPGDLGESRPQLIDHLACAYREELRTCGLLDLREEYLDRLGKVPGEIL